MDYRKYNLIIIVPIGILFLILYWLANTLQPLSGDLAPALAGENQQPHERAERPAERIGRVPDKP